MNVECKQKNREKKCNQDKNLVMATAYQEFNIFLIFFFNYELLHKQYSPTVGQKQVNDFDKIDLINFKKKQLA